MSGLLARYERLVASGELRPDPDQRHAAERLHALQKDFEAETSGGLLSQLFARKQNQPHGIYMWGGVGRGKSMLMDLFVDTLAIGEKRRVHFHEFMLEVDRLIRDERKKE
ncbi:MAG: cell division protein ZapE, partial [Alphaproteobacteria bacterium]